MARMSTSSFWKTIPTFLIFTFLSLLLILFDNLGIFRPVKRGVEAMVVPIKAGVYGLRLKGDRLVSPSVDQSSGEREKADLEARISILKSENEAMRRLLGTPLPPAWKFQPARVIGLPSGESLQIDQGQDEGIVKGMAVVLENALVGKVDKAGQHFSSVLLPSSSGAKILVITRSSQNSQTAGIKARGLLVGYGGKVSLERILNQEPLEEGDLVLTAGDEELPADLLIGKVGKIWKKEGEIYQKAEIKPLIEPGVLETVFVIISH